MSEVVLTIRLIRNFEYRNVKLMVMHGVSLESTVAELKAKILQRKSERACCVCDNIKNGR